jgi:hypothetical protein
MTSEIKTDIFSGANDDIKRIKKDIMICLSSDLHPIRKARQILKICSDKELKDKLTEFISNSNIEVWRELLATLKKYVGVVDDADAVTTHSVSSNTSNRSGKSAGSAGSAGSKASLRSQKLSQIFAGLDTPLQTIEEEIVKRSEKDEKESMRSEYKEHKVPKTDKESECSVREYKVPKMDKESECSVREHSEVDKLTQYSHLSKNEAQRLIKYLDHNTIRNKYTHFEKLDEHTYIIPKTHPLYRFGRKFIYEGTGPHSHIERRRYFTRDDLVVLAHKNLSEIKDEDDEDNYVSKAHVSKAHVSKAHVSETRLNPSSASASLRVKTRTANGNIVYNHVNSDRFKYRQVTPEGHEIDIRVD